MPEMISVEQARDLVLSHVSQLPAETVPVLDAAGRVAAVDLKSDIDISPFAHAAMDGFAMRAAQLQSASPESPVELDVIAEVAAGDTFEGDIPEGACVRIMTGAPLPAAADAVVKYEIVRNVEGDGRPGSRVAFEAPAKLRGNVREAGEEARAGEAVVRAGEVINAAGVGFLAGCGVTEVPTPRRPRVAIISIGSELVPPTQVPTAGKIRNSNGYALAAAARAAGALPSMLPIVEDSLEALKVAVLEAVREYDFVVTSGGASDGDFDFIKPCVEQTGELLMTRVNMRPGKAQTFGLVNGTPVFGLPGNPAAAYCGFEMLIRPALRKMQGYSTRAASTCAPPSRRAPTAPMRSSRRRTRARVCSASSSAATAWPSCPRAGKAARREAWSSASCSTSTRTCACNRRLLDRLTAGCGPEGLRPR